MSESNEIKQNQSIGAQGTQIGIQNNNIGMSPQAAAELAINLFLENFPKLQEEAKQIVQEKVDVLCNEIIKKLRNEGIKDYSAFKEPDMQYILLEAQKRYARLGTTDMLETLSGLICKRVQYDKDFILKVSIDKAIEIAPMITSEQLDFLSLLFCCNHAIFRDIKDLSSFKKVFASISERYKNADFDSFEYLIMHGCLILNLNSIHERYSKLLNIPKNEIKDACPDIIKKTIGDYSLSYTGIILGAMNVEKKTGQKLNLHAWII